jgi:hypothetical protein
MILEIFLLFAQGVALLYQVGVLPLNPGNQLVSILLTRLFFLCNFRDFFLQELFLPPKFLVDRFPHFSFQLFKKLIVLNLRNIMVPNLQWVLVLLRKVRLMHSSNQFLEIVVMLDLQGLSHIVLHFSHLTLLHPHCCPLLLQRLPGLQH